MSDLPTGFWAGWIAVITLVSLAGLAWLVISAYFSEDDPAHEEPVWDGNLREGSNPAPIWWFWFLFATLIFSVIYLMLYPGLGSYPGALKWSQGGRLADSQALYEEEFGGIRATIADARLETLQANEKFMDSARAIFARNCAVCHGYEAEGQASLFPNLIDDDWQWGATPEQIEVSIVKGRKAAMVSWQQVLGDEGVKNVTDYVATLSGTPLAEHPGKAQYDQFCVACHGLAGEGNAALGAPRLDDDIWLYGGDEQSIYHSIAIGRFGVMPAFEDRLDATQVRLLVAWMTRPPDDAR